MDHLEAVLHTFSRQDQAAFRRFVGRQQWKDSRKDLALLDELLGKKTQLVDRKGKQTYHALRKRLYAQLADYVVLKQIGEQSESGENILTYYFFSQYLFTHHLPETAWKYLRKAEKSAIRAERYDLLRMIYLLMIEQQQEGNADTMNRLLQCYNQVSVRAAEDERLTLATALIRDRLQQIKQSAELENFTLFIEEILDRYQLQKVVFDRPAQLYHLLEIVRNTYLVMRQMKNFESFVVEKYAQFNRIASEDHQHLYIRLHWLYMIAHAYYHNKKFAAALEILEELQMRMRQHHHKYFHQFYPMYVSLYSSIKSLQGENAVAIQLHEAFLAHRKNPLDIKVKLNMQLNLAFFYFNQEEYRKANRLFLQLEHSDKWYEKKMGKEWLLRSKLIQSVVQYELAHEDVSIQILKSAEKDFAGFFLQSQYARVEVFIHYLRKFMQDPGSFDFATFRNDAGALLFEENPAEENLNALAFYCWLKAKLLERKYYEVLLEEVSFVKKD